MKLYKLYWHWATSCFAIDQSTTLNLGEYNECCVSLPHSVMRALDWECPLFSLEMFRRWRRRTPIQFSPEPELPSPDSPRRPNPDHTGARSESLSHQSSDHKLLSFPYNYMSPPFPPLKRVLISHYDIKYEILLLLGRHPIPKRMKFQKSFKGGGVVICRHIEAIFDHDISKNQQKAAILFPEGVGVGVKCSQLPQPTCYRKTFMAVGEPD